MDIEKIESISSDLRVKYTEELVENLQIGRGSAWIVDALVDKVDERSYNLMLSMQVDAFVVYSSVFEWKRLLKEYKIV